MEPLRLEKADAGDESCLLAEADIPAAASPRARTRAAPRRIACRFAGLAAGVLLLGGASRHLAAMPGAAPSRQVAGKLPVTQLSEAIVQCPGSVNVPGLNGSTTVQVVNSRVGHLGVDAGQMHIEGNAVVMHMEGRAYFAEKCTDGWYSNQDYKSVSLLGKTVQFEVDLSGTGCGCNVAFYFVAMKQNADATKCQDYYCDANSVCGVPCMEVDVMEANSLVWRSTLHLQDDPTGSASGYGGTGPHQQTWTSKEYGPGSSCIDTNKPFRVLAHFPVHDGGKFQGMMVDLQQEGSACGSLTASVGWYQYQDADALASMTDILRQGMVPVVSYWKSDDLLWLDGNDVNGEVPCQTDRPLDCPLVGPRVMNFEVSDFKGFIHESTMNIKPTQPPVYGAGSYGAGAQGTAGAGSYAGGQYGVGMSTEGMPPALSAAGWMQVQSGEQAYYYNTQTQETSWAFPR